MAPHKHQAKWLAGRAGSALGLTMALMIGAAAERTTAQPPGPPRPEPAKAGAPKAGVSVNDAKSYRGYTLVAPMNSTKTYLIDMDGRVVKTWESDTQPALTAYLLEDGHLLRPGNAGRGGFGPGMGGRVQEFDWDGQVIWD